MRTEPLGSGVQIYVTDTHHFTTDTYSSRAFQPSKTAKGSSSSAQAAARYRFC